MRNTLSKSLKIIFLKSLSPDWTIKLMKSVSRIVNWTTNSSCNYSKCANNKKRWISIGTNYRPRLNNSVYHLNPGSISSPTNLTTRSNPESANLTGISPLPVTCSTSIRSKWSHAGFDFPSTNHWCNLTRFLRYATQRRWCRSKSLTIWVMWACGGFSLRLKPTTKVIVWEDYSRRLASWKSWSHGLCSQFRGIINE